MNSEFLESMIAGGESITLELKVAPPRPSELAERMCGFANDVGGYLVIGVTDPTLQIVGVRNVADTIDTIMQSVRL